MTTYFHTRTVQIAKSQQISYFFEPTLQHSGRHFSKRFNLAFSQEQKPYQIEMLEKHKSSAVLITNYIKIQKKINNSIVFNFDDIAWKPAIGIQYNYK